MSEIETYTTAWIQTEIKFVNLNLNRLEPFLGIKIDADKHQK